MLKRVFAMSSIALAIGGAMLFSVKESDAGGCKPTSTSSSCTWTSTTAWTKCDDSGTTSHNHHHHHGHDVNKPSGRTACDRTRPSTSPTVSQSGSSSGGLAARERIAWRELPLRSGSAVVSPVSASSSGGVTSSSSSSSGGTSSSGGSSGGMGGM